MFLLVLLLFAAGTLGEGALGLCGDIILFFGLKNRRPLLSQREGEREYSAKKEAERRTREREGQTWRVLVTYDMTVQVYRPIGLIRSNIRWTPNSGF